jgi:hypothetical protein
MPAGIFIFCLNESQGFLRDQRLLLRKFSFQLLPFIPISIASSHRHGKLYKAGIPQRKNLESGSGFIGPKVYSSFSSWPASVFAL